MSTENEIQATRNSVVPSPRVERVSGDVDHTFATNLAKITAALPDAVAESMEKTLPEQYTPEAAATLATTMIAELLHGRAVATAKRSLTAAQSTLVADDGLGAWVTAPVETVMRDIDDCYTAAENAKWPFLAAKVVVHDYRSQAYGRSTEVWLNYGDATGTLTPTKARDVLAAMRDFTDHFEAVIELAEREAVADFEGDPEIAAADREAEDRRIRSISDPDMDEALRRVRQGGVA